MNEYMKKKDILKMLDLKKNKWNALRNKEQNVTHKNFVEDVVLVLDWIMRDIENCQEVVKF